MYRVNIARAKNLQFCWVHAYLLDVLAGKLRDELVEALTLSVNTDGGEDGLDVLGRGRLVASEVKEEVSSEVLHFGFLDARKKTSVSGRSVVRCEWRLLRVGCRDCARGRLTVGVDKTARINRFNRGS